MSELAAVEELGVLSAEGRRKFLDLYNELLAGSAGRGLAATARGGALVDGMVRAAAAAGVDVGMTPRILVRAMAEAATDAEARAPRFAP